MKKYLLLAITWMLALASCDNKDEPNKDPLANDPVNIYVSFIENNQDFIYSLDGELIFQAEPGKRIMYLTAEGQDWYAVLNNQSILKNGVPIYSADRKTGINGLAVYHGDYYTLEAEPLYTSDPNAPTYIGDRWTINKNGTLLYFLAEYLGQASFSNLRIHPKTTGQPDVVVDSYTGYGKCPWVNGQEFTLPSVEFQDMLCFDVCDNQALMCYWDYSLKAKYWFSGKEVNLGSFFPVQASIYDGKPYILGSATEVSGVKKEPVLIIDGQETIFESTAIDKNLKSSGGMLKRGEDLYVLCYGDHYSVIFKNNRPIIRNSEIQDGTINNGSSIADHHYRGFIVIDKPLINK